MVRRRGFMTRRCGFGLDFVKADSMDSKLNGFSNHRKQTKTVQLHSVISR